MSDLEEGGLPQPLKYGMPLNEALDNRRSNRDFVRGELSAGEISQLLWAAQGTTSNEGFRTVPSAGATFPIVIHLVARQGVFQYVSDDHTVKKLADEDLRSKLTKAAFDQWFMSEAELFIVVSGVIAKTSKRYGDRAHRYVAMEAGAATQNILLETVSLDFGAVAVGSFEDDEVNRVIKQTKESTPFSIVAVGKKKITGPTKARHR